MATWAPTHRYRREGRQPLQLHRLKQRRVTRLGLDIALWEALYPELVIWMCTTVKASDIASGFPHGLIAAPHKLCISIPPLPASGLISHVTVAESRLRRMPSIPNQILFYRLPAGNQFQWRKGGKYWMSGGRDSNSPMSKEEGGCLQGCLSVRASGMA